MGRQYNEPDWLKMAVIELEVDMREMDLAIVEPKLRYEFRSSASSPAGYTWFDLYVDISQGHQRAARTAWAVLHALKRLESEGMLSTYRIVSGKEWLDTGPELISLRSDEAPATY